MFGNITEVIFRESDQFSQFIQVLYTSQMVNSLREGGPYTIFAPNNYAFSRVPKPLLDKMLQDPETAAGVYISFCFLLNSKQTLSFCHSKWVNGYNSSMYYESLICLRISCSFVSVI